MDTHDIKYFQYARKSSEGEERQALSIEGQINDNMQQVIQRHGLNIVGTITDEASAAVPFNRPGYTEMIQRIKTERLRGLSSGMLTYCCVIRLKRVNSVGYCKRGSSRAYGHQAESIGVGIMDCYSVSKQAWHPNIVLICQ